MTLIFDSKQIKLGDVVAYPGKLGGQRQPYVERDPRDWLRVTRIDGDFVRGVRVNPEGWERDMEFSVYPRQLAENGVKLVTE